MKKRRKLKKKVVIIIIIALILILSLSSYLIYKSLNKNEGQSQKVVDQIPEYGYYLEEDQPKIYKDLFKELVDVLKQDKIDEQKYAKLISQMAAIDFYNLENKVSKNDVGAVQFIRSKNKDNFILESSETVYKYIKQNLSGNRKQELPEVTKSEIKSIKQEPYKYKTISDPKAYIVEVNLEYKKDLGYPKQVTIKLLHTDKKLEIYEMN